MASYSVLHTQSFEKDLRRMPAWLIRRVMGRADALSENPFPKQAEKAKGGADLYKIRIGDYRLVYSVRTASRSIALHLIDLRDTVYKRVRRELL